jgi:hypothetical protein
MFCGPSRGMCGKKADCPDTHCPGRNEALFNSELHRVTRQEPPSEAATERTVGRVLAWIAVAAALAAIFAPIPFGGTP